MEFVYINCLYTDALEYKLITLVTFCYWFADWRLGNFSLLYNCKIALPCAGSICSRSYFRLLYKDTNKERTAG